MSIKIHHGPPGSYKTSGAVADDFVQAALAGRHIVTNVRGLESEDNVRSVMEGQGKTLPETFKLTYMDSTDSEQMEMLRRFWHWSPDGVFFLLDEIQEIYPKAYRETHLNKLNYPGGIDAANEAGKFQTIALAFEKHRHRNWDFVVTSPNINKVHAVVRGAAEAAYKHKNLATLGKLFKGRYIEAYHAADTNGKPSDFYTIRRKAIPKYVFELYKSTATGVVTDTTAGQSIFKDPKILGLLVFIALIWLVVLSMGAPKIFSSDPEPLPDKPGAPSTVVNPPVVGGAAAPPRGANPAPVAAVPAVALPPRLTFLTVATSITITSSYEIGTQKGYSLRVALPDNRYLDLTEKNAPRLGVSVTALDKCFYEVRAADYRTFAYCEELPPPADDSQANNVPDVALNGAAKAAQQLTE